MIFHSKHKILCIKVIQDKITEDELQRFKKWLNKSPKNKTYFNKIKKLWDDMNSISVHPPAINIKNEWALLENSLHRAEDKKRKLFPFHIFTNLKNSALSARKYFIYRPVYIGVIVISLIVASAYLSLNNTFKKAEYQTFTASNKQKVKVQLSDGSSIQLNSGSFIIVQDEFSEDLREVKMNGEAYFEIVKENRPCIVITDNAKIEVLGTAFNVWSRNNITRVIVKDGKVRLSPLKSETEFVILPANHMSQIIEDEKPLVAKQLDADKYIGWPDGKLIFEHSSLSEFVFEIERQYNVNITILSENIKNLKLTGTFDNLTIDQVLSSICLTLNLEYSRTNPGHYIIKQNYTI